MRGLKMAWIVGLAFAIGAWAVQPAMGQAKNDSEQEKEPKAYDAMKGRLVYIQAKKILKGTACDAKVFDEDPITKGTGILLTNRYVLTALHVAQEVDAGQIRCFAIYRETDRQLRIARPVTGASPNEERPQLAPFKDLAILVLKDAIVDQSLHACPPIAPTRPRTGDIVFVTGYKAENIDRRQGKAITDPQTHRSELLSDCNPPFLCDLGRGTPPGHSGAPVIDRSGKLVGILKGGNNLESSFEPILPVREALEPYCESFLTDNYQKYCLAKIRGEREQKGPFDKAGRILCDGARQPDASAQYRAKEGFEIAGFVTHEDTTDDTGNGWVGHAEYTLSDDGKHVVEVNVRMGCTAYGQAGWAETRIYGNIKKILDKKDQESIKKECVAERGVQ